MQVFKNALKSVINRPVYLLVYVVWLTGVALLMGSAMSSEPAAAEYSGPELNVAVIDRDGSDLSRGLTECLSGYGTLVTVEDSERGLQDAAATNAAGYIAIIPEGFEADWMKATQAETEGKASPAAPRIESVPSYMSVNAQMMDSVVNEYLVTAAAYVKSDVTDTTSELVKLVNSDMEKSADVNPVSLAAETSSVVSPRLIMYLQMLSYTGLLGTMVITAMLFSMFLGGPISRRNNAAPISSLSINTQLLAASFVFMLVCNTAEFAVGVAVYGSGVAVGTLGLLYLAVLAMGVLGLAMGFLFASLTTSAVLQNTLGNLLALMFSFLSGCWTSLSMSSEAVKAVAHFIPAFYYNEALLAVSGAGPTEGTLVVKAGEELQAFAGDLGMIMLFAAVFVAAGMVITRVKRQTTVKAKPSIGAAADAVA